MPKKASTTPVKKTTSVKANAPVKKSKPVSKSVKKSTTPKQEVEKMPLSKAVSTKRNIVILAGLVLAIIAVLLYQNKGLFVAAVVNGKPISRLAVVKALEKQSGKATLDSLVTETLILDAAAKNGKSVSQDEIDGEIKRIEDSVKDLGQPLDELLKLQGMTRAQLVQQIKVQKMIEKLLEDKIKVKDEEVSAILEQSDSSENLTASEEAKLRTDIKGNVTQQKISELFPQWLEELKAASSIKYYTNY